LGAHISILGITLDINTKPRLEATANATRNINAKGAIFVAFTPPYYSKYYTEVVFLFSAMGIHEAANCKT
jgi:hypothetical protein